MARFRGAGLLGAAALGFLGAVALTSCGGGNGEALATRTAASRPGPTVALPTASTPAVPGTAVVAVAQPSEGDTSSTPWAWIVVGIPAGGAALGLLFWWIRSRRAAPA